MAPLAAAMEDGGFDASSAYEAVVRELEGALRFGMSPSLQGVESLCEALGRPQDAFDAIQVTGTNGKTSTVRMIEALLRVRGRRTGLYTSPHLERYPERFEVLGAVVDDRTFARTVEHVLARAGELMASDPARAPFTEFELLTASAFELFSRQGVHTAVLEVGLGGRWDATSVCVPRVAVVTGVALDHTAVLGETRECIAAEKAAIIVPGAIAVLGPGTCGVEDVFLARARAVGARVVAVREVSQDSPVQECDTVRFSVGRDGDGMEVFTISRNGEGELSLGSRLPSYQARNLATALAAVDSFLGSATQEPLVRAALATLSFPGRFEYVRCTPPLVVDGSHNPEAATVLASAIAEAWPDPARRPVVLIGVLADKDAHGIVEPLAAVAGSMVVTAPESPRALSAERLAGIVGEVTGTDPRSYATLPEALRACIDTSPEGLVVTGSLTTAGQARAWAREHVAMR